MGAVVEEVPVQRGEQQAVVEEVAVQRGGQQILMACFQMAQNIQVQAE